MVSPELPTPPPASLALPERMRLARAYLAAERACTQRPYPCLELAKGACTARSIDEKCWGQLAYAMQMRLQGANIPRLYWEATFENALESFKSDPNSHFHEAQAYVEHYEENLRSGRNVIIRGDVGKGKTFLAMCMLNALLDRGVDVLAISAQRIGAQLHAKRERYDGSLEVFRRKLYTIPMLYVDEWMTSQYNDDWVVTEFQAIFRERTDRRKPTIASTNLRLAQIQALPSTWPEFKSVIDRLFDNADQWALTVREDYRKAGEKFERQRP